MIANLFCLLPIFICAQTADKDIFDRCVENLIRSKDTAIVDIALYFTGKPYRAGTLEDCGSEHLVVNLNEFDCSTFVESVVALYLTIREKNCDYDTYIDNLTKIRYRNGKIDGYASRLHYASDWIREGRQKNILYQLKNSAVCEKIFFNLCWMTKNSDSYPCLKSNRQAIEAIERVEADIRQTPFYCVPKLKIREMEHTLANGDLVFFTTSKAGLDISHLGIVYRNKGAVSFIHASQKFGKVVVNRESIADYCMSMKSNKGIIICRIN
ncbi:MAG: DUF1460 domain-containing protein [Prevotellaceae bacterium]|nr:DUF1460 domain-containing protein [Prevotellaceae bacterium]